MWNHIICHNIKTCFNKAGSAFKNSLPLWKATKEMCIKCWPFPSSQQMTYNTTEGDDQTSTHDSRPTTPHSLGTTGGYLATGLGSTGAYEYDPSGLESTGGYLPSGLDTGNSKRCVERGVTWSVCWCPCCVFTNSNSVLFSLPTDCSH